MNEAKNIFKTVGLAAVLFAVVGWVGSIGSLISSIDAFGKPVDPEAPYFVYVFLAMSLGNLVYNIFLFRCGLELIGLNASYVSRFSNLLCFQIAYFFGVSTLWMVPAGIGMSVAGATGVGNMGVALQWTTLFPVWALFLIKLAAKKNSQPMEPPEVVA